MIASTSTISGKAKTMSTIRIITASTLRPE